MNISKRIRLAAALVAAAWLALGSAAPATALAGGTRIVDDDYPSPAACPGAGYATIQAAVNSFAPGQSGTIKVCAGTYTGSVSMTGLGKVKLLGKPGATIMATAATSLIAAVNTTRLTVQGLTLDGGPYTIGTGMIAIQNSSAIVTKNVLQSSGSSYGVVAIIAGGSHTLKVTNNELTGVGIGVNASISGGVLVAKVTGNDITGSTAGVIIYSSPTGNATAIVTGNHLQGTFFGMQMEGITKARVSGNTIENFNYGIYLADTSLARVSRNKVRSPAYGIVISANSADASSNKVTGNTIEAASGSFIGIAIAASTGTADFNQIKGNKITDPGSVYTGDTGIYLLDIGGSINGTAIKSNKLTNIDVPYSHSGDTGTVISGNTCTPAAPCIP